jgi:alkylhydroperoxidase family enzyme
MSQRIAPLAESAWSSEVRSLLTRAWVPGVGPSAFRCTVARHEELFKAWDPLGAALLLAGQLPARDRELLILRTAVHARSDYEWGQHVRTAPRFDISDAQVAAIGGGEPCKWPARDAALLQTVDDLFERGVISDSTWQVLVGSYTEPQLIEIIMMVGQYLVNAWLTSSLAVAPLPGLARLPGPPAAERTAPG